MAPKREKHLLILQAVLITTNDTILLPLSLGGVLGEIRVPEGYLLGNWYHFSNTGTVLLVVLFLFLLEGYCSR